MTTVSSVTNTVLTTLDIGSGIDSAKLARDLTDAVQLPQEQAIQQKIDYSEESISAYSLVKYQVDQLRGSFNKLNDLSELATSSGTSSDATKMTVSSSDGTAKQGNYDFTISQLAQSQRVTSDQYTSMSQSLNSGTSFDISLAVDTTDSAVAAIYSATATASETTSLVVGDGTTTVTIGTASYTNITDQVNAIKGGSGYSNLLFEVGINSGGDAIEFTYKTAGSVASTPTFTGDGSTHTITNPTVGVSVSTPVSGVAAEYNVTATASETTKFVVSDGDSTVTIASATYANIAAQVTAIQAGTGYSNLDFTVAANDANDGFTFTYKTTGAVATAPTLTGTGSSHSVSATTAGRTAVNAPTTTTINVATDTPAGVVSAINAADTGVTATLLSTGTGSSTYKILLSGQTGSDGIFTLTSSPDLGFHDTANALQAAQDAVIDFEGLTITRSSNSLSDVIDGATINLLSTSTSNVRISILNDKTTLKTNIQEVVTKYNDLLTLFDNFTAIDSEAEMAGALSEDASLVRFLKDKIRSTIFADSTTPSGDITGLRDIGVSVSRTGVMTFDETEYNAAVLANYDDIATMLTADSDDQSIYSGTALGLAQGIVTALEDLTDTDGVVTVRQSSATTDLTDLEQDLVELKERMDKIYDRYLTQFGAMEGMMAKLDSTKDYLTAQFESLSKAYDSD